MKRNLFPLLGIAFVVAIAATGVFYGLFVGRLGASGPQTAAASTGFVVSTRKLPAGAILTPADLRSEKSSDKSSRPEGAAPTTSDVVGKTLLRPLEANQPVLLAALSPAATVNGISIPKGMRAISVKVSDSAGLLPFLRTGQRIDVQSITTQGTPQTVARTLLSNVEVLGVLADANPNNGNLPVVNLLVNAADVERVALADSAAKIRIVLRNSDDRDEPGPAHSTAPQPHRASLGATLPSYTNPFAHQAAAVPAGEAVHFQVRIATASAETVRDLSRKADGEAGADGLRIGVLPKDWPSQALKVLSTESLRIPHWHEVAARAGVAAGHDLSVRISPRGEANGVLRLRVRPELTLPQRGGVSSRKFSADLLVPGGQSVLLAGFEGDAASPALASKLFTHAAAGEAGAELVILVTPQPKIQAAR